MTLSSLLLALTALASVRGQPAPISDYYCEAPLSVPPPVNASGLTLRHVSIVHRHGARTPHVADPLPNAEPRVNWTCALRTLNAIDSAVANRSDEGRFFRKYYHANQNALAGNCQLGQLLAVGGKQHERLGRAYRAKYVTLLRLLPPQLDAAHVWLRATDFERTQASLQHNLAGLYPPNTRRGASAGPPALTLHTRDESREYMLGGDSTTACPALGPLLEQQRQTPAWQAVTRRLQQLEQQMLSAGLGSDLGSVRDNAWCRRCTRKPQYSGLTDKLFADIDATYTTQYFLQRGSDQLKKLSTGPLFNNIVRMMTAITKNESMPLWAHYSGHDSTMTSVIAVLQRFASPDSAVWPPYAAHVEFELWQKDDEPSQFFVQTAYNGQVFAPFGQKQVMMPLNEFVSALKPVLISETDWRLACGWSF